MTARRIYIVARFLIAAVFIAASFVAAVPCRADSEGTEALTGAEYRAELDRLLSATQRLDSSSGPTPQPLHDLPQSWRVATGQGEFEVSTEGLRRDVRRYEKEKNVENGTAIRMRLQSLRSDLDGFEKPPADVSANRAELNSILARPEFRDVEGPGWLDRLKQRLLDFILHFLERVIRSAAIPTISRFFVYGLMGLAVVALAFIAYRNLWSSRDFATSHPNGSSCFCERVGDLAFGGARRRGERRVARCHPSGVLGGDFVSGAPGDLEA